MVAYARIIIILLSLASVASAGNFSGDMLKYHNNWRAANGVEPPMVLHGELQAAAKAFASAAIRGKAKYWAAYVQQYDYTGTVHASIVVSTDNSSASYFFGWLLSDLANSQSDDWYLRQIRNPEHVHLGAASASGRGRTICVLFYGHGE